MCPPNSTEIGPRCLLFENSSLLNSLNKFSSSGLSLKAQLCHLDQSQKSCHVPEK